MESKNKMLIPLIIVFFIFGVIVGYVAHKPVTIEKIAEKEIPVTVTATVTPAPTATPTQTVAPTLIPTPVVSNFTVKDYFDPNKDIPTYTILLRNYRADPNTLSINPGDTVLIKISDVVTIPGPLMLFLDSYTKELGTGGAAFITFNNKGIYNFQAKLRPSDPSIIPRTYAMGTITVN